MDVMAVDGCGYSELWPKIYIINIIHGDKKEGGKVEGHYNAMDIYQGQLIN